MPTPTYTPLATTTVAIAAASITFGSIPATYRDLILVVDATLSTFNNAFLRFNADTGSNYNYVFMFGNGSSTGSITTANTSGYIGDISSTTRNNNIIQVMDYSATDKHKTYLTRPNISDSSTVALAGRWANTAAITSLTIIPSAGLISIGSTFSLYGVIA
jgi:hypothetical protein